MGIHGYPRKNDMDMDMDGIFLIHGKPGNYAPNLLSVWQIHFEFEHFFAIISISVISKKNYHMSLHLSIKLFPINLKLEFSAIMLKVFSLWKNALRIWTFHCNCPYISHLKEIIPDIIAATPQIISDQSENWI